MTEAIERVGMMTVAECARETGIAPRRLRTYIDAKRFRSYDQATDSLSIVEVRRLFREARER